MEISKSQTFSANSTIKDENGNDKTLAQLSGNVNKNGRSINLYVNGISIDGLKANEAQISADIATFVKTVLDAGVSQDTTPEA